MRKILILAANPKDKTRQRLGEEVRDIEEGLQRSQLRDQFQLEQCWAVRPRDLQRALLDEDPQIVHFTGHSDGETGLFFESITGEAQAVTGETLANLFSLFDSIQCVILNRCYSEKQAQAIAKQVPYVIGMKDDIGERAAIEFSVGFYDAIAAGESVEKAFKIGRVAIAMSEGATGKEEPILLQQSTTPASPTAPNPATPATSPPSEPTKPEPPSTPTPTDQPSGPVTLFFSYAHEDEDLRDKLSTHLKLLERSGAIESWHDRQILPGQEWDGQIDENLNSARIILLLVSADFLASDYCWDVEVKRAMERHDAGQACVIPVILRACDWFSAPFGKLQALPKNAEAVTNWNNLDQAFTDIAQGIRKAAASL